MKRNYQRNRFYCMICSIESASSFFACFSYLACFFLLDGDIQFVPPENRYNFIDLAGKRRSASFACNKINEAFRRLQEMAPPFQTLSLEKYTPMPDCMSSVLCIFFKHLFVHNEISTFNLSFPKALTHACQSERYSNS